MPPSASPCPDAADDPRPHRSLCAAVILEALKDLHAPKSNHDSDREKNRGSARRFFFYGRKDHALPFNLAFCCQALELDPQAIRDSLKRRKLNPVALANALRGVGSEKQAR